MIDWLYNTFPHLFDNKLANFITIITPLIGLLIWIVKRLFAICKSHSEKNINIDNIQFEEPQKESPELIRKKDLIKKFILSIKPLSEDMDLRSYPKWCKLIALYNVPKNSNLKENERVVSNESGEVYMYALSLDEYTIEDPNNSWNYLQLISSNVGHYCTSDTNIVYSFDETFYEMLNNYFNTGIL